jgi:DNA recombination protein RmuC
MDLLSLVVGLLGGAALGFLVAAYRYRGQLAAEEARREAREVAIDREKELFETQLAEMKTTFQGLASEILEASNKSFLGLATERMKPLQKQLDKLQDETREMEVKRSRAYGSLESELEMLRKSTVSLQEQSTALAAALRGSSQTRGVVGEMILRNIVEVAGMTKHCDFIEQTTTSSGGRPDIVVKLPGGGRIPIDAKFPLAAFQDAINAKDPRIRDAKLIQHANDLKAHVDTLKRRDYTADLDGDVDFTVLFLPGDHLLAASYEHKPELQEKALVDRILIATPVTLVALLRTVGLYWKQHDLAEGARDIQLQAEELHKRVTIFVSHFGGIGKSLVQAQQAFNSAVGSYESRVLPAGRQLEALNATQGELPEIQPAETTVRTLKAELTREGSDEEDPAG